MRGTWRGIFQCSAELNPTIESNITRLRTELIKSALGGTSDNADSDRKRGLEYGEPRNGISPSSRESKPVYGIRCGTNDLRKVGVLALLGAEKVPICVRWYWTL
jgi:hypothetical protein